MKIKPLQDRVLVERMPHADKTLGGIIIPESAKHPLFEGTVIAVGNGKLLENGTVRPLDVQVGDYVLFGKYTGTEIAFDDKRVIALKEDDIFAVVEP